MQSALKRAVAFSSLTPGITAAVVSDQGSWQGGAGHSGARGPLPPDAVMAIASISKTFTAAEVLHLAATGKISLDDPVSRYVRNRLTANGATIRQTLGMLSGLPDDTNFGRLFQLATATPDAHVGVQRALALADSPVGRPGRAQRYSNTSFELLGLLIRVVTGKTLAAALSADLFGPAHLRHIAVQDDQRAPAPVAYPFDTRGPTEDGYLPDRAIASLTVGAGSIAADAATVARWGYELYGGLVLPPRMTAAMSTPQSPNGLGSGLSYGLGTMIFHAWDEHPAVGHAGLLGVPAPHGPRGTFDGYTSLLMVVPELHVAVAVLAPAVEVVLDGVAGELLAAATQ